MVFALRPVCYFSGYSSSPLPIVQSGYSLLFPTLQTLAQPVSCCHRKPLLTLHSVMNAYVGVGSVIFVFMHTFSRVIFPLFP